MRTNPAIIVPQMESNGLVMRSLPQGVHNGVWKTEMVSSTYRAIIVIHGGIVNGIWTRVVAIEQDRVP